MKANRLMLNDVKTEALFISRRPIPSASKSIMITDTQVTSVPAARNLGVVFDEAMNMNKQIDSLCSSAYYHVSNIGRIRHLLSAEVAEQLVHAFVTARLDNCNSLLSGIPKTQLDRLQHIQNMAARIVTRTKKYDHITPVLASLHWLPISSRIDFKILLLTFKCIHGTAPAYLSKLIQPYKPSRSLRSADQLLLTKGKPRTKTYGERAFKNCAPALWNALPMDIRVIPTLECFKSALKTHLFKISF
jgi:hypothetical protein